MPEQHHRMMTRESMSETPHRYTPELAQEIEVAWQDRWEEEGTYHAPNPTGSLADPQAVVLWTSGVRMDVKMDTDKLSSLLRGGSGETFQMAFNGQGYVVVQPSESVSSRGSSSSSSGEAGARMAGVPAGAEAHVSGTSSQNKAPPSGRSCAPTWPFITSARRLASANPSPVPP